MYFFTAAKQMRLFRITPEIFQFLLLRFLIEIREWCFLDRVQKNLKKFSSVEILL